MHVLYNERKKVFQPITQIWITLMQKNIQKHDSQKQSLFGTAFTTQVMESTKFHFLVMHYY